MKVFTTFMVVMGSAALSQGILKGFRSKTRAASLFYPISSYRTTNYVSPSAVALSRPTPVIYSPPETTFSAHISTHSNPVLPIPTYRVPAPAIGVPVATYNTPVSTLTPLTDYNSPNIVTFIEPVSTYSNDISLFEGPIIEEHYSSFGNTYAKRYNSQNYS